MRLTFPLAIVFCIFFGCKNEEKIPEGIYSVEKMSKIMIDIHLAESEIQNRRIRLDSAAALYHKVYLPRICEKHGATEKGINESLHYYAWRIDDETGFKQIFSREVDTLSLKAEKLGN